MNWNNATSYYSTLAFIIKVNVLVCSSRAKSPTAIEPPLPTSAGNVFRLAIGPSLLKSKIKSVSSRRISYRSVALKVELVRGKYNFSTVVWL